MRNSYKIPVCYSLHCVFGIYDLAEKRLESYHTNCSSYIRLSNSIIEKKDDKNIQKIEYYQFTHFVLPVYKYPVNSLCTIFIPAFLLALVSLAIFFQEKEISGRIGAIATFILGYIALIPSIKQ